MVDLVTQIFSKLKGIKCIAYIIVFFFFVVGIANFTDALKKIYSFGKNIIAHTQKQTLSDQELKKQSLLMAKDIMEFVIERQKNEPQIDFDNWKESTNLQLRYSTETNNFYYRDYAGKVSKLRDEFLKRGLRNKNLEMFSEHPTNYIGLRELSVALATLSEKI